MPVPKVIIELEILKVNGVQSKELVETEGFRKGAKKIIENLVRELPKHFAKYRMDTRAMGRLETNTQEKKNE